jgi:hypothetical protein
LLNCNIMLNNNKISGIYILTNPVIYKWPNRFVYMFTFFELWCFMIVIIINFIFCLNIIYFCSVKLDFSISCKESGFKIITINWNIAISCIYEWIKCRVCFKNTALKYPGCWPNIFDRSSLATVYRCVLKVLSNYKNCSTYH